MFIILPGYNIFETVIINSKYAYVHVCTVNSYNVYIDKYAFGNNN